MAAAIVDVLIERVTTLALDKIEKELRLVFGVKKEIKNLTLKLKAIRAVLEDAEQRQVTDASVKLWLNELNEVSFDMDDVLDEWITRALMRQLEKQETKGAHHGLVSTLKKVCRPSCSRLVHRHKIAKKIKELNGILASINERKQNFGFHNLSTAAVPGELPQRRKTTSLPNVETFGRDDEKKLIMWLLGQSSKGKGGVHPLIIPVVGMGGMGKTSLASVVYNDERIKSHFDKRVWVCASVPFEEIKIAKAIIEGLDRDNNVSKNSNELQTLTQCISKLIEGKKFILILDDVWSLEPHQWEELVKPLRNGAIGSGVLVTTKNREVVTLMKATKQMIPLTELGEAYCLSLFYHSADMDESIVPKEFSDIGLELVRRCKGLPLAVKTLGRLMQNKKKIHQWRDVLNDKTWELKDIIKRDVFQPLLLSYLDLHPTIRCCLIYCLSFPKGYTYNKNTLIDLWMSQGYLNLNGNREREITGQNYFDKLVNRLFFQDIDVQYLEYGNMRFKIHHVVHDFLHYVSNNDYLNLDSELKASGDEGGVPYDKVHHLSLMDEATGNSMYPSVLECCKRLRTLRAINVSRSSIELIFQLFVELKSLRTLALRRVSTNDDVSLRENPLMALIHGVLTIPSTIGALLHLRYLDLSGNDDLIELPSVMGSLYNLETLKLDGCSRLRKVDVGRLIKLRHLYVNECSETLLIRGIENLTHMQTLDWFPVVYNSYDMDEGNWWEQLKDLNQLQGSLTVYMKGNTNMVENASLIVNKPHLLELKLMFCLTVEKERQVLNELEPHPFLESLYISGYGGDAFSDWLSSLRCLSVLTLEMCACKILPPLGKLASLESLCIRYLYKVSKVGVEFLGIEQGGTSSSSSFVSFPNLKQLTIQNMYSWEEWEGVEEEYSKNVTIMPCLSHLTIDHCPELKSLPDFLRNTPLQCLDICDSPNLKDLCTQDMANYMTNISHIPLRIRYMEESSNYSGGCCIC